MTEAFLLPVAAAVASFLAGFAANAALEVYLHRGTRVFVEQKVNKADADRAEIVARLDAAKADAEKVLAAVRGIRGEIPAPPSMSPLEDAISSLTEHVAGVRAGLADVQTSLTELQVQAPDDETEGFRGGDPHIAREAREEKADAAAQMELALVGKLRERYPQAIVEEVMELVRPTEAWRRAKRNPKRAGTILAPVFAQADEWARKLTVEDPKAKKRNERVDPFSPGY